MPSAARCIDAGSSRAQRATAVVPSGVRERCPRRCHHGEARLRPGRGRLPGRGFFDDVFTTGKPVVNTFGVSKKRGLPSDPKNWGHVCITTPEEKQFFFGVHARFFLFKFPRTVRTVRTAGSAPDRGDGGPAVAHNSRRRPPVLVAKDAWAGRTARWRALALLPDLCLARSLLGAPPAEACC